MIQKMKALLRSILADNIEQGLSMEIKRIPAIHWKNRLYYSGHDF